MNEAKRILLSNHLALCECCWCDKYHMACTSVPMHVCNGDKCYDLGNRPEKFDMCTVPVYRLSNVALSVTIHRTGIPV